MSEPLMTGVLPLNMRATRDTLLSFRAAMGILAPLCALLLGVDGVAAQQTSALAFRTHAAKLSSDLKSSIASIDSGRRLPVIVTTSGPVGYTFQTPISAFTASAKAAACRPLDAAGTYALTASKDEIAALLGNPDVQHISPDRALGSCQDYAVQTVGGRVLNDYLRLNGSGVTVAVLDTGIAVHSDLGDHASRVIGWVDLVNGRPKPYDDNGHGTHVAGIVAGDGTAAREGRYNSRFDWTASGASLVGVKVLDKAGSGTASTVIAGINWCIEHRRQYNIRVINLSLGHPVAESYKTDPLCQACERAWQAGIVVVCAAGNMGRSVPDDPASPPAYGTILSPGNDPQVITVGATNTMGTATLSDDRMTTYSSRGPSAIDFILKPDIVAPGNGIESLAAPESLLFQSYSENRIKPGVYNGVGATKYFRLSGTSMASPVVAGVAALLLQANPALKPDTIKARLMVSATKSISADPYSFGAGLLNAPGALMSRIDAPTGALSPATSPTNEGLIGIVTTIGQSNLIWGNNLIWGDNKTAARAIYGASSWTWEGSLSGGIWSGDPITPAGGSETAALRVLMNGD